MTHLGNDRGCEFREPRLVARIPDRHTRMVRVITNPFAILGDHFLGVVAVVISGSPVRMAGPDHIFVLN
jgi:hypothetical protein